MLLQALQAVMRTEVQSFPAVAAIVRGSFPSGRAASLIGQSWWLLAVAAPYRQNTAISEENQCRSLSGCRLRRRESSSGSSASVCGR